MLPPPFFFVPRRGEPSPLPVSPPTSPSRPCASPDPFPRLLSQPNGVSRARTESPEPPSLHLLVHDVPGRGGSGRPRHSARFGSPSRKPPSARSENHRGDESVRDRAPAPSSLTTPARSRRPCTVHASLPFDSNPTAQIRSPSETVSANRK